MRFAAIAISISLLLLIGCGDEQDEEVAAQLAAERNQLNERVRKRREKAAGSPSQLRVALSTSDGLSQMPSGSDGFVYTIHGRDPFRSFEWEGLGLDEGNLRGPLEQFDVSQLAVVAVIWATGSARALIEDPSGQSYVIGMGARVGKNEGAVVKIDDNLVVVKETYVDFLGHETKKDIEMRIRRSEEG